MPAATAFLSYTRTDDEFHGGYITSFRKTLENAVHVVTGEKTFRVFQDIEGIVIGEQWQKKLTEVIQGSSFFVPMLTPLFFNSGPCREELTQFLAHERSLDRDDLVLPIYFFTSPRLEKEDERAKDPLATELGSDRCSTGEAGQTFRSINPTRGARSSNWPVNSWSVSLT